MVNRDAAHARSRPGRARSPIRGDATTSEVRLVKLERKQTLLAGWFGKINHTGELVRMFAVYL